MLVLIGMFGLGLTQAHNPNEVSYFFKLDDKELVIHLTPKSAIDILEKLYPYLKNQNSFSLQAYATDFEAYFDEHVLFLMNGQPVSLKLVETNLNVHDATLTFLMNQMPPEPKDFDVTVSGFADIYKRAKNHVFIYSDGTKKHYLLNAFENSVKGEVQNTENQILSSKLWLFSISFPFMFLSIGFAVYRKQRTPLKPFHAS